MVVYSAVRIFEQCKNSESSKIKRNILKLSKAAIKSNRQIITSQYVKLLEIKYLNKRVYIY